MISQSTNKYLELEFDDKEVEFLIREKGFYYDDILLNSLKKVRDACLKNRVKNVRFGVNASPEENLSKLLRVDTLEYAHRIKSLGYDFISLNLAQYLAISYFGKSGRPEDRGSYQSVLPKSHYDLFLELVDKLKEKLDFIFHLPTDDFIYEDPTDKLFLNCLHLAHQLSAITPQTILPLSFHAYRAKKSSNLEHDLQVSKSKTADLIIRTARFFNHLEKKTKIKLTLALEMTNQELPTSHFVKYCTSPYQVLETYYLASKKDSAALVEKYLAEGIFSVTCDIGNFLLDQKFNQLTATGGRPTTTGSSLYYGFEEFCRKISVYHINNVQHPEYLSNYLDNRRGGEFENKFGQLPAHHYPSLLTDADKVGEVMKQIELFQNM
ncbi:hypothetical protein KJ903_05190 [Patescibacteria group bacterium]|nr:hypothetical protein [Patescibacteria group bacterium]